MPGSSELSFYLAVLFMLVIGMALCLLIRLFSLSRIRAQALVEPPLPHRALR
jgi:hypothetical protein